MIVIALSTYHVTSVRVTVNLLFKDAVIGRGYIASNSVFRSERLSD
jgi:hypothetical protein